MVFFGDNWRRWPGDARRHKLEVHPLWWAWAGRQLCRGAAPLPQQLGACGRLLPLEAAPSCGVLEVGELFVWAPTAGRPPGPESGCTSWSANWRRGLPGGTTLAMDPWRLKIDARSAAAEGRRGPALNRAGMDSLVVVGSGSHVLALVVTKGLPGPCC